MIMLKFLMVRSKPNLLWTITCIWKPLRKKKKKKSDTELGKLLNEDSDVLEILLALCTGVWTRSMSDYKYYDHNFVGKCKNIYCHF